MNNEEYIADLSRFVYYDLEVYMNFFLAGFLLPNGRFYQFTAHDGTSAKDTAMYIADFLRQCRNAGYEIAGFNSSRYDDPVLSEFLKMPSTQVAFSTSYQIIHDDVPPWNFDNQINSVDLMQLLPGRIGLKKVGVCLGHKRLQELPIPWDQPVTTNDHNTLLGYNRNDLAITRLLAEQVSDDLALRGEMSREYGTDLRSKGDAAMAEAILVHEYHAAGGQKKKRDLNEEATAMISAYPFVQVPYPSWFPAMDTVRYPALTKIKELGKKIFLKPIPLLKGNLSTKAMSRIVIIGDRYYKMGVGGLHSIDGPGQWVPLQAEILEEIDVRSFYPNLALTQHLSPRTWGSYFEPIYRTLVERRQEAKANGDKTTAYTLKIAVNGTYGKSSDIFSALYDPQMTAGITVMGQISLLALIAMLQGVAYVASANTDGITVLCPLSRHEESKAIVADWERLTQLDMEYTRYRGIWQRDVNNYLAITWDGKTKNKGRFLNEWPDLKHTPNAKIVPLAIEAFLKDGTPISTTIGACTDINMFLLTQSAGKGWKTTWNDAPLGNMLRFYKSIRADAAPIWRYPPPGAKGVAGAVSDSDSCVPLEDLPDEFPNDINYTWYEAEANKLLTKIQGRKYPGYNTLADELWGRGFQPCLVSATGGRRSNAQVAYGTEDFSSIPDGYVLGTKTGDGLLAVLNDGKAVEFWKVKKAYPTKTRAIILRDFGFELVYGARVPFSTGQTFAHVKQPANESVFDQYYTPAELAKVRT